MSGSVAFVCALPRERAPLTGKLALRRQEGPLDVHAGQLSGRPVVALVTGMGTALAARQVGRLLDERSIDRVVVVGIAGAVDATTPIATLVLPSSVVHAATGAEYRPSPSGAPEGQGVLWTSDDLIVDPDALAELRGRGVVALDMETAAIAEICERRGKLWSVFRAVSDRATDGGVDPEVMAMTNADGSPNPRRAASYVLRHPGRLPALVRLDRGSRLAAARAAAAAVGATAAVLDAGDPR